MLRHFFLCCPQSRLEECLKTQGGLQQALDVAKKETENEKENSRKARSEWEYEREAMKEEIMELRDNLRHSREMLKTIEVKHEVHTDHQLCTDSWSLKIDEKMYSLFSPCNWKDAKYSQESLASELSKLATEKAEREQRIKDLEEDVEILAEREKEQNRELERQALATHVSWVILQPLWPEKWIYLVFTTGWKKEWRKCPVKWSTMRRRGSLCRLTAVKLVTL